MTQTDLDKRIAQIATEYNARVPTTKEERDLAVVRRFFQAIDPFYEHRNRVLDNYVDGSNTLVPQFDIARDIMPDVFTGCEYSETAQLRPKKEENTVVARLIDEELSNEPAIIVDVGTYDWNRSKEIYDRVNEKKGVLHYVGIDTNSFSCTKVPNLGVPVTQITGNFHDVVKKLKHLPARKLYLFTDNVLMNITNKLDDAFGIPHEGVSAFLPEFLQYGDAVIGETRDYQDPKLFVNGIESSFVNYHNIIKKYVGGTLRAEELHPDESVRAIIIDDINERVEFEGRVYEFKSPELTFNSAMGPMKTDLFSKPYVFLGSSCSLLPEDHFLMSIMNLVNDIWLKKESDFVKMNNHSIFKYAKNEYPRNWPDSQLESLLKQTFVMSHIRHFSDHLFHNFTDLIVGLGDYPSHYNKLLTRFNSFEMSQGMSYASRYFLARRRELGEPNNNMHNYFTELMSGGHVHEIVPEESNIDINFMSLFDVHTPRREC